MLKIVISFFLAILTLGPSVALTETTTKSPLKIGVIIPLSGDWATWGERIKDSLELFKKDHASDLPIEFYYQDEGTCDPKKAFTAYGMLHAQHKCDIFVLGCMNGARAIIDVAKRNKSLLLSAGFQQREIFDFKALLANLALQVDSEAQALARAISASKVKSLAVVRNAGVEDFIEAMPPVFSSSGTRIIVDEVVSTEDRDLSSTILRLQSKEVDGLFINLGEQQLFTILKRLKEAKFTKPIFTSYGTDVLIRNNPELLKLAEGVSYSHPATSAKSQEFERRFAEEVKQTPSINSYFVYDGLSLLKQAITDCAGSSDKGCLFAKISSGEWRSGLGGQYRINTDGSIEREFELRSISSGQIITSIPKL